MTMDTSTKNYFKTSPLAMLFLVVLSIQSEFEILLLVDCWFVAFYFFYYPYLNLKDFVTWFRIILSELSNGVLEPRDKTARNCYRNLNSAPFDFFRIVGFRYFLFVLLAPLLFNLRDFVTWFRIILSELSNGVLEPRDKTARNCYRNLNSAPFDFFRIVGFVEFCYFFWLFTICRLCIIVLWCFPVFWTVLLFWLFTCVICCTGFLYEWTYVFPVQDLLCKNECLLLIASTYIKVGIVFCCFVLHLYRHTTM